MPRYKALITQRQNLTPCSKWLTQAILDFVISFSGLSLLPWNFSISGERTMEVLHEMLLSRRFDVALQCNGNCTCDSEVYEPVCGPDMHNYFNPCFAGCPRSLENVSAPNCSNSRASRQVQLTAWASLKKAY